MWFHDGLATTNDITFDGYRFDVASLDSLKALSNAWVARAGAVPRLQPTHLGYPLAIAIDRIGGSDQQRIACDRWGCPIDFVLRASRQDDGIEFGPCRKLDHVARFVD
jgi:hypothetical protein